jgi:RNA polymerase sigma-70 factor, ECF subfamily
MPEKLRTVMDSQRSGAVHNVSEHETAEIPTNWANVVERIRDNDQPAIEELYRVFSRGIRYYLCRQLGPQDLDDRVHDCFLVVIQAIRKGDIREPERLMGFVRTIVRRQIAGYIEGMVETRKKQVDIEFGNIVPDEKLNPERSAMSKQQEQIAVKVLKTISSRDREILTRFYLHEQSQEQICREMSLTETQFRLMKSRAKAKFGELGKRRLERKQASLFDW